MKKCKKKMNINKILIKNDIKIQKYIEMHLT